MSGQDDESQNLIRMRHAILKWAIDHGQLEAMMGRTGRDLLDVDAEFALMPPADVAAIRTGQAPLPSPPDAVFIACLSNCRSKWERERKASDVELTGDVHHEQQRLTAYGQSASIDCRIVPLVTEVWRAGFETGHSCENHAVREKIWVEFSSSSDAERFINIVAPHEEDPRSIYQRVIPWYFGMYGYCSEPRNFGLSREEREKTAWEVHVRARFVDTGCIPEVGLSISVLIPHSDLETVVQRLRDHNERRERAAQS